MTVISEDGGLPMHGQIACSRCFSGDVQWGRSDASQGSWRITNNPLAWGNPQAEVVVLGFSKGPTQAGALERQTHEQIAFRGGRTSLAKILHHVGLLAAPDNGLVDGLIADSHGRFHFGSFIRCTVERYDSGKGAWTATGAGMLDRFVGTEFGRYVVGQCSSRYLTQLPASTKLILMLGMGSAGGYVRACRRAFEHARPGPWKTFNEVAYTDGKVFVVHTEHFKSQGSHLPNWLSGTTHPRGRLGLLAREAVAAAV
ncbi:MAG: hypothetical protein Q8R71_01245 [Phenylobacterium sp.]|nr:hypothetical protein [Phenylobacterium sp.]